jgi:hypothetical protein
LRKPNPSVFVPVAALVVTILCITSPAFAADTNVVQVQNFIRSIIQVVASLAGLVATAFFVGGGLRYIMSSGNPEQLQKSKSTLIWAATGLAITIGAYALSSIVTNLATSAFGA